MAGKKNFRNKQDLLWYTTLWAEKAKSLFKQKFPDMEKV